MESNSIEVLLREQNKLMQKASDIDKKIFQTQRLINQLMFKRIKNNEVVITESDIMTEQEVCDWLGKSKASLYRWRNEKGFPHTKIEGQKAVMYSRKAIEAYFHDKETRVKYTW